MHDKACQNKLALILDDENARLLSYSTDYLLTLLHPIQDMITDMKAKNTTVAWNEQSHLCLDMVHLDRVCHNSLARSLLLLTNLHSVPRPLSASHEHQVHGITNAEPGYECFMTSWPCLVPKEPLACKQLQVTVNMTLWASHTNTDEAQCGRALNVTMYRQVSH